MDPFNDAALGNTDRKSSALPKPKRTLAAIKRMRQSRTVQMWAVMTGFGLARNFNDCDIQNSMKNEQIMSTFDAFYQNKGLERNCMITFHNILHCRTNFNRANALFSNLKPGGACASSNSAAVNLTEPRQRLQTNKQVNIQ